MHYARHSTNGTLNQNRGFSSKPGNEKGTLLRKTAYKEIDCAAVERMVGRPEGPSGKSSERERKAAVRGTTVHV